MADSVDDLLAQMKALYGDAATPAEPLAPPLPPPAQPPPPSVDSLDHLLADLDQADSGRSGSSTGSGATGSSFPSMDQRPKNHRMGAESLTSASSPDPLLESLKAQYEAADRLAQQQQQQQQAEQRRHQDRLNRQRRAAHLKQAEAWLKQLDPRSGEAVWFEEFATNYPSRLAAAIDYLGLDKPE